MVVRSTPMDERALRKARYLQQEDVTWQCSARLAPTWLFDEEDEPPHRPYAVVVLEVESGTGRAADIPSRVESQQELGDLLLNALLKGMSRPLPSGASRYRPRRIEVDNEEMQHLISPVLEKLDIEVVYQPCLPMVEEWHDAMARILNKEDDAPRLVDIPDVDEELLEAFYTATAEYYRRAPWRRVPSNFPFEITASFEDAPRYAAVMGFVDPTERGLALYDNLEQLIHIYLQEATSTLDDAVAMTYGPAYYPAPIDLHAIEKQGWPIADQEAYPFFFRAGGQETAIPPTLADVKVMTAALRCLPDFIEAYFPDGPRLLLHEKTFALEAPLDGETLTIRAEVPFGDEDEEEEEAPRVSLLNRYNLEPWIQSWYWDEASHEYAFYLGQLLFDFLTSPEIQRFSDATVEKHFRNAHFIGYIITRKKAGKEFNMVTLLHTPIYIGEFRQQVSSAKSAEASYRATWNKFQNFVRRILLDYLEEEWGELFPTNSK
jgi:hypothetical protein